MENLSTKLAEISLGIGAIQLNAREPFTWASGYRMPIYNDNRMLLGDADHRKVVTDGLLGLVNRYGVVPDFIAGTATAGIAPAASLASRMNLPLVMQTSEGVYAFSPEKICLLIEEQETHKDVNIITSTCPYGIVPGVCLANELGMPFAYVRAKNKSHGKRQKIEGITQSGQKAHLIDACMDSSYAPEAVVALKEVGVDVLSRDCMSVSQYIDVYDLKGKRGIVIEDLISMGGSSANEVLGYRNAGALIVHCFSIFNYGLSDSAKAFSDIACAVDSVLDYDTLLDVARGIGSIGEDDLDMLARWREDPTGWGDRHGFPRQNK